MRDNTKRNQKGGLRNSYRDELKARESGLVDERFAGGAFGCPGEYFRGADAHDCRSGFRVRCENCWSRPYADEEWIPYKNRDE